MSREGPTQTAEKANLTHCLLRERESAARACWLRKGWGGGFGCGVPHHPPLPGPQEMELRGQPATVFSGGPLQRMPFASPRVPSQQEETILEEVGCSGWQSLHIEPARPCSMHKMEGDDAELGSKSPLQGWEAAGPLAATLLTEP